MQLLLLGETSWTRVLVLILVRRWVVVVVLCNDYIDGLINLKFGDWFPKRYMFSILLQLESVVRPVFARHLLHSVGYELFCHISGIRA